MQTLGRYEFDANFHPRIKFAVSHCGEASL